MYFQILAAAAATAGAWADFWTHKIPNRLTVTCLGIGVILRLTAGIWIGISAGEVRQMLITTGGFLADGALGFAVGCIGILLWFLGALKAGDVKLYMAVGAIGGWRFCLNTEIFSILIGGAAAFLVMLFRKNGRGALKRLWLYGKSLILTRTYRKYEGDSSSYFCFGCMIAAGAWVSLLYSVI